jgi:hypothetical protein
MISNSEWRFGAICDADPEQIGDYLVQAIKLPGVAFRSVGRPLGPNAFCEMAHERCH